MPIYSPVAIYFPQAMQEVVLSPQANFKAKFKVHVVHIDSTTAPEIHLMGECSLGRHKDLFNDYHLFKS